MSSLRDSMRSQSLLSLLHEVTSPETLTKSIKTHIRSLPTCSVRRVSISLWCVMAMAYTVIKFQQTFEQSFPKSSRIALRRIKTSWITIWHRRSWIAFQNTFAWLSLTFMKGFWAIGHTIATWVDLPFALSYLTVCMYGVQMQAIAGQYFTPHLTTKIKFIYIHSRPQNSQKITNQTCQKSATESSRQVGVCIR